MGESCICPSVRLPFDPPFTSGAPSPFWAFFISFFLQSRVFLKNHIFTSKIDQGRPGVLFFDIRKVKPAKKKSLVRKWYSHQTAAESTFFAEGWGVSVFGLRRRKSYFLAAKMIRSGRFSVPKQGPLLSSILLKPTIPSLIRDHWFGIQNGAPL